METEQSLLNQGIRIRFLEIIRHLNLSREEVAKKLECDENHIIEIEKDHHEVSEEMTIMLCTELNINLNWLISGVGWMFQPTTEQSENEDFENSPRINQLMKALKEEEEKLNDDRKKLIELQNRMKG